MEHSRILRGTAWRRKGSMSEAIKAIETYYNGYRFRSRLEARWAVFFDALGITYQYEPEGFVIDGKTYLPDFYLPKFDIYAEVKPNTDEAFVKVEDDYFDFVKWGGPIKGIVILSDIPNPDDPDFDIACFPIIYWSLNIPAFGWWQWWIDGDIYYVDNKCNNPEDRWKRHWYYICGMLEKNYIRPHDLRYRSSLILDFTNAALRSKELTKEKFIDDNSMIFDYQRNCIGKEPAIAFRIARQARFEHGQAPIPSKIAIWNRYGIKRPEEETR